MVRPDYRDGRQGDEFRSDGPRSVGRRGGSPNEVLQPQRMPPPPKRNRRKPREGILSVASGVLSFVLVLAIAVAIAVSYAFHKLDEAGPLDQDKTVFIARGTNTADAIEKLESEKVIEGGWLFNLGLKLSSRRIKAGEYRFAAHASARQVMATLSEGKPLQHTITLPEGLTSLQIVQRLKDLKDDDGNELLSGDVRVPREGSLMPNTYKFARGDSRESIIKRMTTAQATTLEQIWNERDPNLPIKSSYDLVTLASIVEKETGKADERPMVAGVFINRLNRHMKLQSDPTIIYGIVKGQGTLGRPLRRSDIDRPTEYNTYTIEGLPPGPIANPGRAAMEAVARPAKTKALYFVADGTGGHAFAETIDQHQRNVARWRQIEKEAKDKASPDAEPPPEQPQPQPARPPRRGDVVEPVSRDMMAKVQDYDDGTAPGVATKATVAAAASVPETKAKVAWAASGPATKVKVEGAASGPATKAKAEVAALVPETKVKVEVAALVSDTKAKAEEKPDPRVFQVGSLKVDLGPSIEQRGWSMDGVDLGSEDGESAGPSAMGDDPPSNGSAASYPLSPGQLADLRARQKKYASASDLVPDASEVTVVAKTVPTVARGEGCGPRILPGRHVVAFDASEGTRLDPMRNKTFDLNTVKIVPEAVVKLIPVFSAESALSRVAALAAADDCGPDTRSAKGNGKPDRIQLASLSGSKGVGGRGSTPGFSNGFDASEGTLLDPLRNHRFDITTTQTVPGQPRIFEIPADVMQPLPDPPAAKIQPAVAKAAAPAASTPIPTGPVSSHGFDASEGTRLDPLRDKTFDLNSAQTVPGKVISFDDPAAAPPKAERSQSGAKPEHRHDRRRPRPQKADTAGRDKPVRPPQEQKPIYVTEGSKT